MLLKIPELSINFFNKHKDLFFISIAIVYIGVILFTSSFYFLCTEDYEHLYAFQLIEQGKLIGPSTGLPFLPVANYIMYAMKPFLPGGILGLRIIALFFILLSIIPIYLTARMITNSLTAFSLTIFSFILSTFPHPRLEYYFEGAFITFAILFAMLYIKNEKYRFLVLSAFFSVIAYISKGFPQGFIFLFIIPFALAITANNNLIEKLSDIGIQLKNNLIEKLSDIGIQLKNNLINIVSIILLLAALSYLLIITKSIVYNRIRGELAFINVPDFLFRLSTYLIIITGAFVVVIKFNKRLKILLNLKNIIFKFIQLFIPTFLILATIIIAALLVGYTADDIRFFLFPLDIIIDHFSFGRMGNTNFYLFIFLLSIMFITNLFLLIANKISKIEFKVATFLLFMLLPAAVRFFPSYNMLYLFSYIILILFLFINKFLSSIHIDFTVFQKMLSIFIIIATLSANYFIIFSKIILHKKSAVSFDSAIVKNIFIEKDVSDFFKNVNDCIQKYHKSGEDIVFLSNRYLHYVPLIYNYNNPLGGNNLVNGLGKLWNINDIISINGDADQNQFSLVKNNIYRWRKKALDSIKRSNSRVIVMSFYFDENYKDMPFDELKNSLTANLKNAANKNNDPLQKYLSQNYALKDIISPDKCKDHVFSIFNEGAVLFIKN